MSYGSILARTLSAALVVGVVAAGYLIVVVEPVLDEAIAIEEMLAADGHGEGHAHDEPFSRSQQKGAGAAAMVLFSLAVGLVSGTVFAWRRHRLPGASDLHKATWLATVGFVAFALVPAITSPANPPGVGDPDTVGNRTLWYVGVIAISVVLIAALTTLTRRFRESVDPATRTVVVAAVSVAAFGLVVAVTPGASIAVDPAVPAELVWDFRVRSLGGLALVWVGWGLAFGWLLTRRPAASDDAALAPRASAGAS